MPAAFVIPQVATISRVRRPVEIERCFAAVFWQDFDEPDVVFDALIPTPGDSHREDFQHVPLSGNV